MKHDLRLELVARAERTAGDNREQALAAIRARTAMEVMKERRELKSHLYDVMGPGDESDESTSLLTQKHRQTRSGPAR